MDGISKLKSIIRQKNCWVGLGNSSKDKDAIGVRLARKLAKEGIKPVITAETILEKYIHHIAATGADIVIFLDGIRCEASPATVLLMDLVDEVEKDSLNFYSHRFPLSVVAKYLWQAKQKYSYLLGIVLDPTYTDGMPFEIQETIDWLASFIKQIKGGENG